MCVLNVRVMSPLSNRPAEVVVSRDSLASTVTVAAFGAGTSGRVLYRGNLLDPLKSLSEQDVRDQSTLTFVPSSRTGMSINDAFEDVVKPGVRAAGSVTERLGRGLVELAAPVDPRDAQIAQLNAQIAQLESENAQLRAENRQLRAEVARLAGLVESLIASLNS